MALLRNISNLQDVWQVGIMRRSRYVKGKKVGKGPLVEAVSTLLSCQMLCSLLTLHCGRGCSLPLRFAGAVRWGS